MEFFNLNEGVRACFAADGRFSSCHLAVLLKRPLRRQEVTLNAMVVNVLGLGCHKYPSIKSLEQAAAELFGGCFECMNMKKGEYQLLEFYAETIDEENNVLNAAEFLKEIILNPYLENGGFKREYVEREKAALRDAIRGAKDDKKKYAKNRLLEEMFKGDGLGVWGDGYEEDIYNITPELLYEHYKRLIESCEVLIIAVGSFDETALKKALKNAFKKNLEGYIGAGMANTVHKANVESKKEAAVVREAMDVSQGKLCLGIRTKADYYALLAANEVFGGGADSRLFLKAREGESLCYYINSAVLRSCGVLIVQAGIAPESLDRVLEIVNEELKGFDKVTDNETESAKENIIKQYIALSDRAEGLMNFYLSSALWNGAASPHEAAEKIKALKGDDVRKALKGAYADTVYFLSKEGAEI